MVDVVIALFVVAAIVGIAIRFNLTDTIILNSEMDTFEIEFITEWDIQKASQQYFEPGVIFYVDTNSVKLGEIIDILDVRDPAFHEFVNVNGEIVKSERPGRIDVIGLMKCAGRITKEGNYMINGNVFVAPSKTFLVHTGYLEGTIRVISVKKVD